MPTKKDAVATVGDSPFPLLMKADPAGFLSSVLTEMNVGAFDLNQIRVPAKGAAFWTVETSEGPQPMETLNGVILGAKTRQRKWFQKSFDESDGTDAPSCYSSDGLTGRGVNVLDEGAEPGEHDCASCPWSQFGSHRGTGRGQDCSEFATLVFLREGCTLPDVIQVPATSLKALTQFNLRMINDDKDPKSVRVGLGLRAGANSTLMTFSALGALSEEEAAHTRALGGVVKGALISSLARS